MSEEKSHEHKHHEHSHKKKDETFKLEFSKTRVWQVSTVVLGLAVVYLLFFNTGSNPAGTGAAFPTLNQPSPTPTAPSPGAAQPPARQEIDLDDDPVLGDPNAPVTIVSFEDYQCPFCGRAFQQTLPLLKEEYIDTGKAKLVFRDFPLSFHPNAQSASEASECADDQGKFWEYHDDLFNNQNSLGKELYIQLAEKNGLDVEEFTQCIDSGEFREEVQNDFAYGSSVGVSGTPTFFINGIRLVGAQPYQAFKQVIDAELAG